MSADTDTITGAMAKLAGEASAYFTTDTRDNGDQYVKTIDRPEWLESLIFDAHGAMLPEDYRYRFTRDALQAIADADSGTDAMEVCDDFSEPDIYTSDLTAWLGSRNDRHAYCDEAVEELGMQDADTLTRIGLGQSAEMREVFASVLQSLADRLDELDEPAHCGSDDIDEQGFCNVCGADTNTADDEES